MFSLPECTVQRKHIDKIINNCYCFNVSERLFNLRAPGTYLLAWPVLNYSSSVLLNLESKSLQSSA